MAAVTDPKDIPSKSVREETEGDALHNYAKDGIKVTSVDTIMEQDKEDESLMRYKKALLGAAADVTGVDSSDGDRRAVIVDALILHHPKETGGRNVCIPLTTEADVEAAKAMNPVVKEGAFYTFEVRFRIHKGIVSGLQLQNKVYGSLGMELDRDEVMLGSFAPKVPAKCDEVADIDKTPLSASSHPTLPVLGPDGLPVPRPDQYVIRGSEIDQYPSGMMSRGQYYARCKF